MIQELHLFTLILETQGDLSLVLFDIKIIYCSIIPVLVNVTIRIESIESIEEVKMSFSAKFKMILSWTDGRIVWNDLTKDKFLNIPNQTVVSRLWVPNIVFVNTKDIFVSPLDKKARVVVDRRGDFSLSPIHDMEEVAYYKGSENPIQYGRDFFLEFQCQFYLKDYPFDSQICTILMKMTKKDAKFIKLVPKHLKYFGPLGLAEFFITHLAMTSAANNTEGFDIKVSIKMKRRIILHLQTTYLPSLCILIIAQVILNLVNLKKNLSFFTSVQSILRGSTSKQLYR